MLKVDSTSIGDSLCYCICGHYRDPIIIPTSQTVHINVTDCGLIVHSILFIFVFWNQYKNTCVQDGGSRQKRKQSISVACFLFGFYITLVVCKQLY